MLIEKISSKARKDMEKLDKEFEKMSELNRMKSSEIRNSIHQKSLDFKKRKHQRDKHFGIIRNK